LFFDNKAFSNSISNERWCMKKDLYGGHDPSTLVEACVTKVCETYVVAYPRQCFGDLTPTDSVTLSLCDWKDNSEPQSSQVIMLVNPMLYSRGWRAREAYPITPQGGGK
jgi:hypothetical protein